MLQNTWLVTGMMIPAVWAGCKFGPLNEMYLDYKIGWYVAHTTVDTSNPTKSFSCNCNNVLCIK